MAPPYFPKSFSCVFSTFGRCFHAAAGLGNGYRMRYTLFIFLSILITVCTSVAAESGENISPDDLFTWQELPNLPHEAGIAGAFIGTSNGALIIAGGSSTSQINSQDGQTVYHDSIYVLEKTGKNKYLWHTNFKLPHPVTDGASVVVDNGLVCLGGRDENNLYEEVFILNWNEESKEIVREELPGLPLKCHGAAAARVGNMIYAAGGMNEEGPLNNFMVLDLMPSQEGEMMLWQELQSFPGLERYGATLITQNSGYHPCLYLFSGKHDEVYLNDAYFYDPREDDLINRWKQIAPMPRPAFQAPAAAIGQSHIMIFGGSDGHYIGRTGLLKVESRFADDILAYHTITDTWVKFGHLPQSIVHTGIVPFAEGYVLASGETSPGIRTTKIFLARTKSIIKRYFHPLDYTLLILYLVVLMGMGFYFSKREKTTKDYLLAGKRIPFWAAGLSMLATGVSSIGFMAIPAKAFATNWVYFTAVVVWFIVVPFINSTIIPFYHKLKFTSVYEYLEARFNIVVRLIIAGIFCLFQILGRMSVVLFLPALALSAVTGIDKYTCILLMGVFATVYTVLGGMEAVIWTDVIQLIVLMGGAILCIVLVLTDIDGGVGTFFEVALTDRKLTMAIFKWDYTEAVIWVVLLNAIITRLLNLCTDQTIVQRIMTTADAKEAKKALWCDCLFAIPWSFIAFGLGTVLYVYYKTHPQQLNPTLPTDAVVPLFIVQNIPIGLSGIIIAGIFAAAMSSLDSSMHSTATVIVTDFYKRSRPASTDHHLLVVSRWLTGLLGMFGTGAALWMAKLDSSSMWDVFIIALNLFGGAIGGVFALGIFTNRTNSFGVITSTVLSVILLCFLKQYTDVHFFLYSIVGMTVGIVLGYSLSFITPGKPKFEGLTVHSLKGE